MTKTLPLVSGILHRGLVTVRARIWAHTVMTCVTVTHLLYLLHDTDAAYYTCSQTTQEDCMWHLLYCQEFAESDFHVCNFNTTPTIQLETGQC